jgi:hypothetical protein
MDLSFSHIKRRLALGMVALAGLVCATAFAGDLQLEKAEPPGKGASGSSSNTNRLDAGQSKSLRDAVSKPSNFFKQPMEDEKSPFSIFHPPRAPQLNKQQREALEQRKNWAFTDWKELSPERSTEDMLGVRQYGPDGKETKSLSPIEKFYQSFDKTSPSDQMSENIAEARFKDPFSTNMLTGTGLSVTEEDQFFHRLPTHDFLNAAAQPDNDGGAAVYGSSAYLQVQAKRLQEQHRQDFQKLLDPNYSAGIAAPNSLLYDPSRQGQPANINPAYPTTALPERTSVLNPLLGIAKAPGVYHSHLLDDPTAHALGLPDPSLLPKLAPTSNAPPPSAFPAALPRRSFP